MSDEPVPPTSQPAGVRGKPRPSLRAERVGADGVLELFIGLRRELNDDGTIANREPVVDRPRLRPVDPTDR